MTCENSHMTGAVSYIYHMDRRRSIDDDNLGKGQGNLLDVINTEVRRGTTSTEVPYVVRCDWGLSEGHWGHGPPESDRGSGGQQ